MTSDKHVIADYLAALTPEQRSELERVRRIVHSSAPKADEVITYGMPGFKYQGKYLLSYAAFKDHMSIFPGSEAIVDLKPKLSGYKLSKGTIQFTIDKPLPDEIIKTIVELGVHRIDSGA